MGRTKNNPKLSNDQWLEVQKEQIKMVTKVKDENEKLKLKVQKLEERAALVVKLQCENEKLKEKNQMLEAQLLGKNQEACKFLARKAQKVLITGDSHLKSISVDRLKAETKINLEIKKTYCSIINYPGSKFPLVAISSVLQHKIDPAITHLVITAPTSDLTNVSMMDWAAKRAWAELSAKYLILISEWCLIHYISLQQVVLMLHLPR